MKRPPWEITRDMFLSEQEADLLLRHVRERSDARGVGLTPLLDRLLVESLLFSGLRTSEFCRLTLADGPTNDLPAFTVGDPAGEGRRVYLPAQVCDLITHYVHQFRPQLLPEGAMPDDPAQPLVFHERRRPFERTGLYRRVVRILSEAGLGERASVQLLRHTYGYLAYLRTGGNLLFVQRQLGHAHPMITSIYARFVHEPYDRLAERVAGVASDEALLFAPASTAARDEVAFEHSGGMEELSDELL